MWGQFDLEPYLATAHLGRLIEIHERLPSTNDRAVQLAREGGVHGLTVVAAEQTAGRGQRGRRWHSPTGAGLYASFLLRPNISPRMAPALTLVAGLAVRGALHEKSQARLAIKWPNDVLTQEPAHLGRKVAGILVEVAADSLRIEHAVIGVGVNVHEVTWPDDIASSAVALDTLAGMHLDVVAILGAIANHLEVCLDEVEARGLSHVSRRWTQFAAGIGEEVVLALDDRSVCGVLEGIAEDGALRLRTSAGSETFYRGELRLADVPRPGSAHG